MSMITYLVEKLRIAAETYERAPFPICITDITKTLREAADTIEELSAKLHASQMERSIQYYNDGWIPCEDRLPEEKPESQTKVELVAMGVRGIKLFNVSDEVLVTVHDITEDKLFVSTDSTMNGKWRELFHQEYEHSYEVLAWQPKPIPYKAKERD